MAANKKFNFGPLALTTTYTTNILNPAAASGGTNAGSSGQKIYLTKITVTNKGAASSFRLYKGATGANAAGTEICAVDRVAAANADTEIWLGNPLILTTSDFLVGGAADTTRLTIRGEGEIGVDG